jgi:RimJ/RimL family protein N-acetyltransferase
MAAFTAEDPTDRDAFDAHWRRIRSLDPVVTRTILVERDGVEEVAGSILKYETDGEPEVSYWVGRDHWGRGIATQALRLFLREVAMRPMRARVAADNLGSIRVLEKCGFVRQSRTRGYANARGAEIDEYVYVLSGA